MQNQTNQNYDVIVIGAGHAGVEAANAAASLKAKTLLVTFDLNNIASMPCNPAVGGPAKGIVTREISAMGGVMGHATDACALQVKLLNSSRGPAVWALRAQVDKTAYSEYVRNYLEHKPNLTLLEAAVSKIIIDNNIAVGIKLEDGTIIDSKTVILTTGTYLRAEVLCGAERKSSGPDNQRTTTSISEQLKAVGFQLIRLKTGTPPRLYRDSIDFSKTKLEPGTDQPLAFSSLTTHYIPFNEQLPCYLTYTTRETHQIISDNLELSPMYSGKIIATGPRYCPSIEDKIVKFADKDRHQIFLEPLNADFKLVYVQGLSTCFPPEIQQKIVNSIPGLEHAKVASWGYAIEYDALDPLQLNLSLETKLIQNLYTAGQINGTSGYEEAAGQGLIAGINAGLKVHNKNPLILKRSEAYIGLMIDDLVTKGVTEPYRLLTSRAEYRLSLRNDNAEFRLSPIARNLNLLSDKQWEIFCKRKDELIEAKDALKTTRFTPKSKLQADLIMNNKQTLKSGYSGYDLVKRSDFDIKFLLPYIRVLRNMNPQTLQTLTIDLKFAGYIKQQNDQIAQFIKLEKKQIPIDLNYNLIHNLAFEAKEKLNKIRPLSVGQASRISGINPADIQVLLLYLHKTYPLINEK